MPGTGPRIVVTRRLKYDIPGCDWRVTPDEVREKGWEAIFAPALEAPFDLVVEIGFGRGEFLAHLAREAPRVAHVGVEISRKRILKMARRLARSELENVRLVCARAEDVVGELLAPASVRTFWVNFSDPWPKKRHHRRRVIQPAFVAAMASRLVPGGRLEIATDHPGYAEWIDAVLSGESRLENVYAPQPWRSEVPGRMHTAYEEEWRAEGRSLHFFSHRRRPGAATGAGSPIDAPGAAG